MGSLLLENGIALLRDANGKVVPAKTSILIEGSKIVKIGKTIQAGPNTEVIDCTDKVISPGFIDTHHHGWQTQLKGRHANELLLDYLVTGASQSFQFTPLDTFYGQLSGMLEALSAGTTTLVEHAHINVSADHSKLAIAATASSGIRSVFCYTPIMRVKQFNPLTYHENPLEDWVMQTFSELAQQGPWADGRVTLGFAFDLYVLPPETIKQLFVQVKSTGVRTITTHSVHSPQLGEGWPGGVPSILKSMDLLDETILISHQNRSTKEEVELIRAAGAHISSTPSTELQMGHGRPVLFDAAFLDGGVDGNTVGAQDIASLGIDCHSNNAGSIVEQARLGLQNARSLLHEYHLRDGKTVRKLPESLSVEAAFNLATVKGAEAVRMEDQIGKIQEGFKADLVIFDALSPSMLAAAQHDPVAAIILHSSPADIEMVIVDGVIRKKDEKLLPVTVDETASSAVGMESLGWNDIAKEVVKSRERMQKDIDKIDWNEATKTLASVFHVPDSCFAN